jgi:hypothetical protein
MALFSLLQLTLIGVPVMLLIDQDDVTARTLLQLDSFFLHVCLCWSHKDRLANHLIYQVDCVPES